MLKWAKREEPAYYQKHIDNKVLLQFAFFGFENGTPFLHVRSYKAVSRKSGDVQLGVEHSSDCLGKCSLMALLGEADAIDAFINTNPHYYTWRPNDIVLKFIEIEIQDKPSKVGPPVDIVHIDGTGIH